MRKFVDNHVEVDCPKKPKKITGTRFAAIMGLNDWNTPFSTWCEITRTYQEPFEDNMYTLAGKAIEPKMIDYLNNILFLDSVKSPTDIYGKNYFDKTRGDFFPESKIFGGMWDALVYEDGKPTHVIEIKTTKRVEDWEDGKAPEYYALQASLYAYLLGIDNVVMAVAFLEEGDYDSPEDFVPNSSNVLIDNFKIYDRFPNFDKMLDFARDFWYNNVATGVSPSYDEKKDADILKALRTNTIDTDDNLDDLLTEAENLMTEIDNVEKTIAEKQERLKTIKEYVKSYAIKHFRDGDNKVSFRSPTLDWSVSRSKTVTVDKKALEKDGLLNKYSKESETIRLTTKNIKTEEK